MRVILNLHMKRWTGPRQTGLLWLDHAESNQGLQRQMVMWNLRYYEILCSID